MTIDPAKPFMIDVASDWGGCSDERLRGAFAAACEFIWGLELPGSFLETGEAELSPDRERGEVTSALGRVAMVLRGYLPVERGSVLAWHDIDGRFLLRLFASDREDDLNVELFRRHATAFVPKS
jgi:hypothetical protein